MGPENMQSNMYEEIANRLTAYDFQLTIGLLPDPDPILKKLPDAGYPLLTGLLSDPHLMSLITQRKMKTLKNEYRWTPGDDTESAKNILEQFESDLSKMGKKKIYDLFTQILDAPFFGYVPIELIWAADSGFIRLKDIRPLPQHWFGFAAKDNTPRFLSRNHPWEGELLPDNKFVIASHQPTFENPYGIRLLSRCYWAIEFKRGGIKLWLAFLERFGVPSLIGKYPRGFTKTERNELVEKLLQLSQRSVGIVPEGGAVEILDTKSASSSDIFEKLRSAMNKETSAVILGQASALDIGDQSTYASSKVVGESIDDLIESDKLLLKSTMNDIAAMYTRINSHETSPPTLSFYEDSDPKSDHAKRDEVLTRTGVQFTEKYYEKTYGLKLDEFKLSRNN